MRYLFILLLFVSVQVYGQPHIEWGGSLGISTPLSTKTLPAGANPTHLILLMETDVFHDRKKQPICVTWGARIGAGTGNGILGLVVGAQYTKAVSKANAFRVGLVAGPWVAVVVNDRSSIVGLNFIPELYAGLLHKRLYLGIKYQQPIKPTDYTSVVTRRIDSYQDMGVTFNIKIRFGKLLKPHAALPNVNFPAKSLNHVWKK